MYVYGARGALMKASVFGYGFGRFLNRLLIVSAVLFSSSLYAQSSYCPFTTPINADGLMEMSQKLLGYQRGAERMDDVFVGVGLIPSANISENVRAFTEEGGNILGALIELDELCKKIYGKDPVEQYFYMVDKLFSVTPAAPWISANVKMATAIVSNANLIAANTVSESLEFSSGAGVEFQVALSQFRKRFWNKPITGAELIRGNHLRSVRVFARGKATRVTGKPVTLNVGYEGKTPDVITLGMGNDLIAQGVDSGVSNIFFELVFANDQRMLIPLDRRFFKGNLKITFPIVIRGGVYELGV